MNNPTLITVFEHERLYVGEKNFTIKHFEKLVLYNEEHQHAYFNIGYQMVKFKSYVGVIQMDNITIEILPKADKASKGVEKKWRNALIEMLQVCERIQLKSLDEALLRPRYSSLIELYFDAFLNEIEDITHKGLTKQYRFEKGNTKALKGQIQFSQQIAKNFIHKERFYTSHQTYDYNNIYNQILKKAIIILEKVVSNFELQKRANQLLLHFENVSNVNVTASTFDGLVFGRKRDYYQHGIQLARLIILNYAPNLATGNEHILAILFDMNRLFEEYIFVKLSEVEYEHPSIEVRGQAVKKFWKHKTIRPDIIIINQSKTPPNNTIVIDTKWKIVDSGYPSDSDLKQMYAYNLHFGALKSVLLYPKVDQESMSTSYHNSIGVADKFNQHECEMYFLDLFKDDVLNANIGIQIIDSLSDWLKVPIS